MSREIIKEGEVGFAGYSIGRAVYFQDTIKAKKRKAKSDEKVELQNLNKALKKAESQIQTLIKAIGKVNNYDARDEAEASSVLNSHIVTLYDPVFKQEIEELIKSSGKDAFTAVKQVTDKYITHFRSLDEAEFKSKASDVLDLQYRLLTLLGSSSAISLPKGTKIVIANKLRPEMILHLKEWGIEGLVLNKSTATGHDMIIARALRLPALYGISYKPKKKTVFEAIVDSIKGRLIVNPKKDTRSSYQNLKKKYQGSFKRLSKLPTVSKTKDGKTISTYLNIEVIEELDQIPIQHVEGVGLYRSEFIFLRHDIPDIGQQVEVYSRILQRFAPKPVTIRLFDLGGDKLFRGDSGMVLKADQNQLGLRSIRFLKFNETMLHDQLLAILRASTSGFCKILIPMLSTIEEFHMVDQILRDLSIKEKIERPQLGVMIETPAAISLMPILNKYVDFYSVGSNDLLQYITAADRNLPALKNIYSPLHLGMIEALENIVKNAQTKDGSISLTICGEIAADRRVLPILFALGYQNISISPSNMFEVKSFIEKITFAQVKKMLRQIKKIELLKDREKFIQQEINALK